MSADGGLQFAVLYDGVQNGKPYFATHRVGVLGAAERTTVAQALTQGTVVMQSLSPEPDVLSADADADATVDVGYATDGVFVWSLSMAHYVRTYGVEPDPAFAAHLQSRNCQLHGPEPTPELEEAVTALLNNLPSPDASDE